VIAASKLSGYASGRFGPKDSWENIWKSVLNWLEPGMKFQFYTGLDYVTPMFVKDEILPPGALINFYSSWGRLVLQWPFPDRCIVEEILR